MNKRGLNNIIIAIVLVFLSVISIILIYSPIRDLAEEVGGETSLQQQCILTDVRVLSCTNTTNEITLKVQVARGEVESVIGLVEFEDGSIKTVNVTAPKQFETREIRISMSPRQFPRVGKAAVVISDGEGNTKVCAESPLTASCGEIDEPIGSCVEGTRTNCPLQAGVCAGSQQTCTNQQWPECTTQTYLNHDPRYEITESSCNDGLDNDCDGLIDSADSDCASASSGFSNIGFALELNDGTFKEYSTPTSTTANTKSYSDQYVDASIRDLGNNQFGLTITNKDVKINSVWFPYETAEISLNSITSDDIIYYPSIMGVAIKQPSPRGPIIAPPSPWQDYVNGEICYPGNCFSPIIVLGDSTDARGMASLNWPPKPATPKYQHKRIALKNNVAIQRQASDSFTALYKKVSGDSATGNSPWYPIADDYRSWLKQKMTSENLYPINYPSWMKNIDGFIAVYLQDTHGSSLTQVQTKWNIWKDTLPWIVLWGQMSDWTGPMNNLPGTGCCLMNRIIHSRYLPPNSFDLISFANNIAAENKHIAYYQRPMRLTEGSAYYLLSDPTIRTTPENTQETALQWLQEWIRKNEQNFGSNSFYIDVLGAVYFGDPLFVAKLFVPGTQNYAVKPESFIEHPVDIYPTAYLMGGAFLPGGAAGGPGKTLDNSQALSFPQFGRYILDDRIFFGGSANGDWYFWGNNGWPETTTTRNRGFVWPEYRDYCNANQAVCEYWTERQIFLLGAKFDARMIEDLPTTPTTINKVLGLTISERARVNWWQREPRYLDRKELSNIPNNVEIRRFADNQNKNLFVIDNWNKLSSVQFTFQGQNINVNIPGGSQIYIHEIP